MRLSMHAGARGLPYERRAKQVQAPRPAARCAQAPPSMHQARLWMTCSLPSLAACTEARQGASCPPPPQPCVVLCRCSSACLRAACLHLKLTRWSGLGAFGPLSHRMHACAHACLKAASRWRARLPALAAPNACSKCALAGRHRGTSSASTARAPPCLFARCHQPACTAPPRS